MNASSRELPLRQRSNAHGVAAAPGSRAANPFWRWSLRAYRAPGVQEACLALQDRCGADVNLLLFCAWVGVSGRALDKRLLRQATNCVGRWQTEVVAPLRAVRRTLKHGGVEASTATHVVALRRRIAALELEFERVEQHLLFGLASTWPAPAGSKPPQAAVAANLERYLAGLPCAPLRQDAKHLRLLADACCASSPRRASARELS